MSKSLWEIGEDLEALDVLLDECDGQIDETIDRWLLELDGDMTAKVDGYASLIGRLEAQAKARREEANRMTYLARVDENKAGALKARLLEFFGTRQIERLDTERYRLSVAKNGGPQPWRLVDADALPESCIKIERTIDKKAVAEALKAGDVPGVELTERGTHLRIK